MATKTPKPAKKQEKITFQPDPGYREVIDRIIDGGLMGPKRSVAFVINEYLRRGFEGDGLIP